MSYIIEVWNSGEDHIFLGPFRTFEKADSRREFIEETTEFEVRVSELMNSHTSVSGLKEAATMLEP